MLGRRWLALRLQLSAAVVPGNLLRMFQRIGKPLSYYTPLQYPNIGNAQANERRQPPMMELAMRRPIW